MGSPQLEQSGASIRDSELGLKHDGAWLGLSSEVPSELAQVIKEDYAEEDRERLANAAVGAALANVQPNPSYADITARSLALDAVRFALGLKVLPEQEGEKL